MNHVTLWDRIITKGEDCVFSLHDQEPEYDLIDHHQQLGSSTVNLTLHWEVKPLMGPLKRGSGGVYQFEVSEDALQK